MTRGGFRARVLALLAGTGLVLGASCAVPGFHRHGFYEEIVFIDRPYFDPCCYDDGFAFGFDAFDLAFDFFWDD